MNVSGCTLRVRCILHYPKIDLARKTCLPEMCIRDSPGVEGNYLETSGTALFAYAVLKGVRLGYLPKRMAAWAEKAFYGTCDKYLSKNPDGSLQLDGICLVAGLGGKDHRDLSLIHISPFCFISACPAFLPVILR